MVSDVVFLFGTLWFPVFFIHREKAFDVFRLIFFSFNVIANLNFLVTAAWYCKPRSIHLFILPQTAPSMEFLQLFLKHSASTYIPLHYNLIYTLKMCSSRREMILCICILRFLHRNMPCPSN